jgi:Lon protease-like protein
MSVPCAVEQCPRSAIGRGLGIWSEHRAMFGPDLNAGDEAAASSASALGQGPGFPPMDGFVVAEPDQALSLSVIPAQAKGKTSAYAVKPFGYDDASTSSTATFLRADVTLSKAVAVLRQHAAVGVSSPVQQLSAAARRSNERQNAASARRDRESAAALSRGRRRIRRSLMSGEAPRRALNALPRRQSTVQQEDDRVPIAHQFLSMLGGSEEGRESGAVGGIHAADSDSDDDEESLEDSHPVGASGLVSWHSAHAVSGDYDTTTDDEADFAASSREYAEAEAAQDEEEGSDDDFGGAFGRDSSPQSDRAWFAAQERKTRASRAQASEKRRLGASLVAHGSSASSHRVANCDSDWETDSSALGSGLAASHASAQVSDESSLDKLHSELLDVLECHLCYLLLHEPLTTPCGHTFCRSCLSRSLDHSSKCPLCRASMPPFSFFLDHPTNASILKLLNSTYAEPATPAGDVAASLALLPASLQGMRRLYTERKAGVEQEEREASLSTPVFVCTVGFPGMPTILHIFEPRYRLMIRRCVESGQPRFGMVLPSRDGSGGMSEYGTLLDIKSVQMLPDGRSMIETVGSKRFRLAESGGLDGYIVGRIETIDDIGPEEEAALEKAAMERNKRRANASANPADDARAVSAPASNEASASLVRAPSQDSATSGSARTEDNYEARQLQSVGLPPQPSDEPEPSTREMVDICESFITELRSGTAPWLVTRLNHTYGPMPPLNEVSRLSFWMASVM